MEFKEGFSVEITGSDSELWRYNIAVICGCFASSGSGEDERRDFISAEDTVAPVGSNLAQRPAGIPDTRRISFTTVPCEYLQMYVYVIPHTLPAGRDIADFPPLALQIKVSCGNAVIHSEEYHANAWSGASIELRIPKSQQQH